MNFFDAWLVSEGGGMTVDTGCFRVPVPVTMQSAYQDHVGRDVIFGMRPADIHYADTAGKEDDMAPVEGLVEVVEPLGSEMLLFVKCGEGSVIARVDSGVDIISGQAVRLAFHLDKMHLFDSVGPHRRLRNEEE
jgi:multiple sugar transport system ATP-binding protein